MANNQLLTQDQIDAQRGMSLRKWLNKPEVLEDLESSLTGWISAEQFKAQILVDINSEALARCTPESKFAAVLKCATLQLLPSLNHVALIASKVRENGVVVKTEVRVTVQWQGYQSLMLRHPDVKDVRAVLVHQLDEYKYDPVKQRIVEHAFDPFDESRTWKDFKDVRGGYVVVEYKDPNRDDKYHFVTCETIRKAMGCAETVKIWNAWFFEMCMKTLYRNAYARRVVPMDPMLARRMEELNRHEDQQLGNDPNRIVDTTANQIERKKESNDEPKSRADFLANRNQNNQRNAEPEPDDSEAMETEPEAPEQMTQPQPEPEALEQMTQPEPEPKPQNKDERGHFQRLKEKAECATSVREIDALNDEAGELVSSGELPNGEFGILVELFSQLSIKLD